jgi:prepilin-type N-terminal cleavage/methylation domain-containing protein
MKNAYQRGFTIVELLIVIVVIAILAAITLVSYNGIQQRALDAAVQTEVSQAISKIEAVKGQSGSENYPDATALNLQTGSLSYFYEQKNNTYCVQARKNGVVYSSTNLESTPTSGDCTERGLIDWWQFNNSTNDSAPNGITGVITGAVTPADGQNGQPNNAYQFTSAGTSYISASGNHTVINNTAQTFSMWIRPTDWSSPTASVLFAKRSSSTGGGFFMAYISSNNSLNFDCGSSANNNRFSPGYVPALNVWTHIVFTCSTNSGVAFYANGVPAGTTQSRPTVDRSSVSTTPVRFGQDSVTANTYSYNGRMDDVRFYNRVLTSEEIANLYANGAK